jgi:hypothetical protein
MLPAGHPVVFDRVDRNGPEAIASHRFERNRPLDQYGERGRVAGDEVPGENIKARLGMRIDSRLSMTVPFRAAPKAGGTRYAVATIFRYTVWQQNLDTRALSQ